MKKIKNFISHLRKSLYISWKSSPSMFTLRLVYELYTVFASLCSSYLIKDLINLLSMRKALEQIVLLLIWLVVLQIISSAFARISAYVNTVHNEKMATYIKLEIINKINTLDISYFDNPRFYDEIQNATRDSKSFQSLSWIIVTAFRGIIQVFVSGIILGKLAFYIPLVIFALNIPSVIIDKILTKKKYDWQRSQTENERKFGYIESILQSKNYAKDVRVYHTHSYFKSKFVALWEKWFKEKNKIERNKYFYAFLGGILPILSDIAILLYVCVCILNGTLSLGDFTYYRSMVSQFRGGMNSVLMSINNGYESEMRLTHYTDFLKWNSLISDSGERELHEIHSVEFRNVSFTYPGTNKEILHDISFTMKNREKIALVGPNGSGKSTLIKLLLRLYEPSKGEILINNINIKEYTLESLHDKFGVVFQDFNKYLLTIKEAVSVSKISCSEDKEKIEDACRNADISLSDAGLTSDTVLGKIFDADGVVLSGGQWQKIAIAQAYFKDSCFVIMDEPNASLDPESEDRMFKKLQELSTDKCGLIITHRLSSVFIANKILVLEQGRVIEMGTHEELISNSIVYKKMFEAQAEKYKI